MRRLVVLFVLVASVAVLDGPPASATDLGGIQSIQTGQQHTCALLTDGTVRCWGDGSYGKLGNNDPNNAGSKTPVTVLDVAGPDPLGNVTQIALGDNHTCALLASRQVRCWGFNDSGQLATNTGYSSFKRPQVALNVAGTGPLTGVLAIDAGGSTTCALLVNHQVRCWGYNGYGGVGAGSHNAQLPRPVSNPAGTGRLTGVAQISVGDSTTCVRLTNGQARCWGYNISGQVGDGTRTNRFRPRVVKAASGPGPLTGVTQISAGEGVSCARLQNSQVRCWGRNVEGGLGIGNTGPRSTRPVAVKRAPGAGNLAGVTNIEAGVNGACARMNNGRVRCWGYGDRGQIGNGDFDPNNYYPDSVINVAGTGPLQGVTQLSYTTLHACVRVNDGTARCWGSNLSGQLGNGDGTNSGLPVVVAT